MRIEKQSHEVLSIYPDKPIENIEKVARVCYKSEDKINSGSAAAFVNGLNKSGHHAMLEFGGMTVKFTCNRAIANELVRHRLCSFAQTSTRYCNYSKDKFDNTIAFILPEWVKLPPYLEGKIDAAGGFIHQEDIRLFGRLGKAVGSWAYACSVSELKYFDLIEAGIRPQDARDVLAHSLKTELVIQANFREWKHIFRLRTDKAAHPQIRALIDPLKAKMQRKYPEIF